MSYIRSGSNPEGLYIWGDKTTVHVAKGGEETKSLPKKIFHGLIRKYHTQGLDVKYKGASLKQEWIKENGKNECKTVLAYDDWTCPMWDVTWEYI